MKTNCSRLLLGSCLIALLIAPAALGQCPDLIELDCSGGTAWFGLRYDGANVAQGQTVTLPCDAAILGAEFYFHVTGNPNADVPSLMAGDEIHVTVVDDEGSYLMTATATVPADVYAGWIAFEFPEDVTVTAGVYLFAAYTNVERQCSMAFCPGEDLYADGVRMTSMAGLEGEWFEFLDGHDVPFRVHLNSTVPVAASQWTGVKALFR
jgi:hypothetical protein